MKTVDEIKEKIKVFKRKLENLPLDDERYISSQGTIAGLEWVIREELYTGEEYENFKGEVK